LRREAAEGRNGRTARYLLGEPLLGDLLAEGLEEFGVDWSSERTTRRPLILRVTQKQKAIGMRADRLFAS
jgi:hypothetical protein